ncbi:MAG TPA: NACHT domain-containing protein, partial [Flavisolibacter sp.]|nr:NACHT domain-containing protein [Flavisolibacter sp.]
IVNDFKEREKVKLYLESIRIHGNPASHNANSNKEKVKKPDLEYTQQALKQLLFWFFKFLNKDVPHQIKGYLLNNTNSLLPAFQNDLDVFEENLQGWFSALGYDFGEISIKQDKHFLFSIKIPERRKTLNVLIYGLLTEIKVQTYEHAKSALGFYELDEVWIVTSTKASKAVINLISNDSDGNVLCYNFDELIEQDIDLSKYFDWLKNEVKDKKLIERYVPVGCEKVELDEKDKSFKAKNVYNEEDGFTEGYLSQWLNVKEKEHISVLGEFGTGKTWLALHFAYKMLEEYEVKKKQKLPRPRIPILIYLRDFSKAINVEALISDFFFRKHKIELKGVFDAFMQLNKMGKLLLVFDGFDEMADKVDKQKMINNFWELASVIHFNSKVILTCRSEHFPQIKEGRSLLNAELKDATKYLTGDSPQFEVLQLLKFNDEQIEKVLSFHTDKKTIKSILSNSEIKDLLRRPIMTDLILDALEDIKKGLPIDMSRIYLYATRKKMERDIEQSRTFTSLADKLYFMCELSWDMLANDKLKIHFKEFHKLTDALFGYKVVNNELDYWRYDMRGQTMLIIDEEDGYYKPAHKSFLEFFTAFKFAAQLGIIAYDFLEVVKKQSNIDFDLEPKEYTWSEYFVRQVDERKQVVPIAPIVNFKRESLETLVESVGKEKISRALLDLISSMVSSEDNCEGKVFEILSFCRGKDFEEVGYLATNVFLIMTHRNPEFFKHKDISALCLRGLSFPSYESYDDPRWMEEYIDLQGSNLSNSDLQGAHLGEGKEPKSLLQYSNLSGTIMSSFNFRNYQIDDFAVSKKNGLIIVGAYNEIVKLDINTFKVIDRVSDSCWDLILSPDESYIVHSGYGTVQFRSAKDFELIKTLHITKHSYKERPDLHENLWTGQFVFCKNKPWLIFGCNNRFLYFLDLKSGKEIKVLKCSKHDPYRLSIDRSEQYLLCSGYDSWALWDLNQEKVIMTGQAKRVYGYTNALFHPSKEMFITSNLTNVKIMNLKDLTEIAKIDRKDVRNISFSSDCSMLLLCSGNVVSIYSFDDIKLVDTINLDDFKGRFRKDAFDVRIEKMYMDSTSDILYVQTRGSVLSINIKSKKLVNQYWHLEDYSNVDLSKTVGIEKNIAEQLEKNGAII